MDGIVGKMKNLNWNEAVDAMEDGKIVKTKNDVSYRILDGTLQFEIGGDMHWNVSFATPIKMGHNLFEIVEEKKTLSTLSDNIIDMTNSTAGWGFKLDVEDVRDALTEFVDWVFLLQGVPTQDVMMKAKDIFGERLIK